jgi:acetyl-CoA carboxylase biotin carboxyl carrier protein
MDLIYLKKLIKLFEDSNTTELSIEEEGVKIKLSKTSKQSQIVAPQPQLVAYAPPQQTETIIQVPKETIPGQVHPTEHVVAIGSHAVNSPMVGTFYRSPSPESPTFVEVGTQVTRGQTLCIIEAMKLMNEIESDVDGIVEKIFVQNGSPVEFNQPLFEIKPL